MAFKTLVFLALCLAVAESQNGGGYNNNNNNGDSSNGGSNSNNGGGSGYGGGNNNNNNNGGGSGYGGGNSNNNNNNNGGGGGGYNNNNNNNNNRNSGSNNNRNNNNNNNGFCKSLEKKSRSLTFNCTTMNGDPASCTERIAHGTKAKLGCKKNYVVQDETMIPEMSCSNGVWNRELKAFKCLSVPIAVGYNYTTGLGFYKFYKSGRKWDEAKKICENDGGHLATIDSPEERDAINGTLTGLPNKIRVAGSKSGNSTKRTKSSGDRDRSSSTSTDDLLNIYLGYSDTVSDGNIMSVKNESMSQGWCDAAKSEKAIAIKKKSKNCITMRPGPLCYVEAPCLYKRSFVCEIEPKSNETESSTSSSSSSVPS